MKYHLRSPKNMFVMLIYTPVLLMFAKCFSLHFSGKLVLKEEINIGNLKTCWL